MANLGTMSDVLLSTPLLESIRNAHPTSRITCIVNRGSAQVLDYSPFVNELLIWPNDTRARANGIRMVRKLARRRFDAAVTLSPNPYLHVGFWLGRARIRVGFTPSSQEWTFNPPCRWPDFAEGPASFAVFS